MHKVIKALAALSPLTYLSASVAHAQDDAFTGLDGASQSLTEVGSDGGFGSGDLTTIVAGIINVVLGLLGLVFVVLIIYAGFLWMTAGGSADTVKKGKAIMINAIIGLIITVAAYAISSYVISAVVTAAQG